MTNHQEWDKIIESKRSFFVLNLKEVYNYRDLLFLFVRRDFVSLYKQTILGPLWFFIQPILTTLMFTVVFGSIAKISTDGLPNILFYMSGLTFWTYFADSLNKTSNTFIENQGIFGKVYFPRLITPLSIIFSNLFKFGIQFLLFLIFYFYFYITEDSSIKPNWYILLTPYLIILTGFMGLAFGLIITSLTTKYRDLRFLIQFGVQLWMYATPVIYPLSSLSGKARTLVLLNPMTSIIETFKFGFLGSGTFRWENIIYSTVLTLVLLFISILIFNKTEQNFMDTV